jgi:hypothetical protein
MHKMARFLAHPLLGLFPEGASMDGEAEFL